MGSPSRVSMLYVANLGESVVSSGKILQQALAKERSQGVF